MASEPTDGGTVSVGLPEDLESWLDERADDLGLDRDDLLQRLLAAYRAVATAGEEEFEPQEVDERLTRLAQRHEEALEDVRKRVLQLKTRTERKVDADHEALEQVDELDERVTALETRAEERTERSVGREELADVQEKLTRVASAVVALRDDGTREPDDEADASAATPAAPGIDAETTERLLAIKRTAAREGYERAACGACDESAHVHLLPEPACPACGTPFDDLVETGGFRKRPTLVGAGGAGE